MKKLTLYYLIHIALNLVLVIAFRNYLNLHILSILPLFLMVLMIFQASLFRTEKNNASGDTAYSAGNTVRLTDEEQAIQYSYMRWSFFVCLPFELPLIFFLHSYWKLLGIVPYILAYVIGGILFKVKMGQKVQSRADAEKRELEDQIKREELGLK